MNNIEKKFSKIEKTIYRNMEDHINNTYPDTYHSKSIDFTHGVEVVLDKLYVYLTDIDNTFHITLDDFINREGVNDGIDWAIVKIKDLLAKIDDEKNSDDIEEILETENGTEDESNVETIKLINQINELSAIDRNTIVDLINNDLLDEHGDMIDEAPHAANAFISGANLIAQSYSTRMQAWINYDYHMLISGMEYAKEKLLYYGEEFVNINDKDVKAGDELVDIELD